MRRKIKFEDLTADLEFYVECPECDKELIVADVFAHIRCPHCGTTFKPHMILVRTKSHKNPSFRGFSAGELIDEQEKRN